MKSGRGGQGLAGKHIFCEMWNPATVPGRCGAKAGLANHGEFPATCQVRTACLHLLRHSLALTPQTPRTLQQLFSNSAQHPLTRDSFSPSSESLGLSFSWQILVSASSGRSSPTQLELTSSLLSDKKRKKKKVIWLLPCARHSSKGFCVLIINLATTRVFYQHCSFTNGETEKRGVC